MENAHIYRTIPKLCPISRLRSSYLFKLRIKHKLIQLTKCITKQLKEEKYMLLINYMSEKILLELHTLELHWSLKA